MSVVNWNSYYNRGKNSILDTVLRTISLWTAIGLLWLSFCRVTETWLWPFELEWWVLIPWLVLLWALYEIVFPRLRRFRWIAKAFPWINGALIALFLTAKLVQDTSGLRYIVSRYLEFFNHYYFTNIVVDGTGGRYTMAPILTAIVMLIWLFFWDMSYRTEKRAVLACLAIVALIATITIGIAPGKTGVICMFIAIMLLFGYNIRGVFMRIAVPVVTVISLLVTGVAFEGSIYDLTKRSDELIAWEQGLDIYRIDLSNWGTNFFAGSEQLNNQRPNHNGRDILYVHSEKLPMTAMYFKGFYATTYENGTWQLDESIFAQVCKEAGYSEEEMAKKVSRLVLDVLYASQAVTRAQYDVEYLGGIGDVAYVPYSHDYTTLNANYKFSGDYVISKPAMELDMSFKGLRGGDLLKDPSIYTRYVTELGDREFREWYNEIAAQYVETPDGIDGIDQAVEAILSYMTDKNDSYTEIAEDEVLNQALKENYRRTELVDLVRAYLDKELSYNLSLSVLPEGVDAVEYALTQSHAGYCMHYASAATLILRELGVPCRYASGYVVRPTDFKYSAESKEYVALVEDYRAHAWVEVYYDYIGWVPVEMTEPFVGNSGLDGFGEWEDYNPEQYEDDNSEENEDNPDNPSQGNNQGSQNNQGNNQESQEDDPQDDPIEQPDNNQQQKPDNNQQQTPDNVPEEDPKEEEPKDEPVEDEHKPLEVKWYVPVAIVAALLCVLAVTWLIRHQKLQKKYLEDAVSGKDCRNAVRRMNRRIYLRLRLKNLTRVDKVPVSGYITDQEYGELLKETFPCIAAEEWETYMEIVKKMYYSKEIISEEEMLHCYKCYKNPQMKLLSGRKLKEQK